MMLRRKARLLERRQTQIPLRAPRYAFGAQVRNVHGFEGRIDAAFCDYWAALASGIIAQGLFEAQSKPPSGKDQVFYSVIGDVDIYGRLCGAVLVAEDEIEVML